MRHLWRWSWLGVLVMLAALGGAAHGSRPDRDGVFIHISHGTDDPHRVLTALNMAAMMAPDHDVLVYFDIQGIEVVLADSPDLALEPFPHSRAQLRRLAEQGVVLMACPGCLRAAGKQPGDLAEGIRVADRATFFDFSAGRILSLDY